MHICISTQAQNIQSQLELPPTHQTTTTSFETATLKTPIQHSAEAAEKNHVSQADDSIVDAVELLQEATIDWKHAPKPASPLSDSTPMLNRKHEDPTPLINGSELRETMRMRFKSPSMFRWLANVRLQWRICFYIIVGLAILLLLYAAMNRDSSSSTRIDDIRKGRISAVIEEDKRPKVRIEVYMESQCPDTADFLDSQLMPTWNDLKDYMNLQVVPFGKARWTKQDGDDFSFQCQHGQNECLVNQLMCCGIDRLKTADLYLPYIVCLQNTRLGDEDEAKCAQQARIPNQEMQSCANSKKGRQLHQHMGNLTKSLNPPLYFVPWVLVDGRRDSEAVMDLKNTICKKLNVLGVRPATCDAVGIITTPSSIR